MKELINFVCMFFITTTLTFAKQTEYDVSEIDHAIEQLASVDLTSNQSTNSYELMQKNLIKLDKFINKKFANRSLKNQLRKLEESQSKALGMLDKVKEKVLDKRNFKKLMSRFKKVDAQLNEQEIQDSMQKIDHAFLNKEFNKFKSMVVDYGGVEQMFSVIKNNMATASYNKNKEGRSIAQWDWTDWAIFWIIMMILPTAGILTLIFFFTPIGIAIGSVLVLGGIVLFVVVAGMMGDYS